MKVKVRYFASVREIVNLREEVVDVPSGTNARVLLDLLAAKHGVRLKEYLFDEKGNPRPYLQLIVDGKSLSETSGFATLLSDGCEFAIVPPVGGG